MWVGLLTILAGSVTAMATPRWRGGPNLSRSPVMGFAVDPLAASALSRGERSFLERAAELSSKQMEMARVAVSRATSSDVRTYAQLLAADHRQISDSLNGLRRKKGTMLDETPAVESTDEDPLSAMVGGDFDREFVRRATEAEAKTLMLFEELMSDAKDTDVRELIGTCLPMLREHRNRGTELKKGLE